MSVLALACGLGGTFAHAHSSGFHKRDVLVVHPSKVEVLITMDVDSGQRCALLRAAADADRDGTLSESERHRLRAKLASMAAKSLKVGLSGFPLSFVEREAKLDLRGSFGLGTTGVSVAMLLEAALPEQPSRGMSLTVVDVSPDRSHVRVEVHQATPSGGESAPPMVRDISSGEALTIRLEGLKGAE